MTISWIKLRNCPKNIEDSKILLVGFICSMAIFSFFTVVEKAIGLTVFEVIVQAR